MVRDFSRKLIAAPASLLIGEVAGVQELQELQELQNKKTLSIGFLHTEIAKITKPISDWVTRRSVFVRSFAISE